MAILGWVGTDVFKLWIKDFRKKDEAWSSAHLKRGGPRSPHDMLVFNGSRFACLHSSLPLPKPRFYCVEKRTRCPERSTIIQGSCRENNSCPASLSGTRLGQAPAFRLLQAALHDLQAQPLPKFIAGLWEQTSLPKSQ